MCITSCTFNLSFDPSPVMSYSLPTIVDTHDFKLTDGSESSDIERILSPCNFFDANFAETLENE